MESNPQATSEQEAKDKQFIENLLSSVTINTSNDDKERIFDDIRTLFLDPDIRQLYYNYVESLPNFYVLKTDPELAALTDEVFISRLKEERSGAPKPTPPDELLSALKEKKRAMTESNTIITASDDTSLPLVYPIPSWIEEEVDARNKTFTTFEGQQFTSSSLKTNAFMNSLESQKRFPHRSRDVEMAIDTYGTYPLLTPAQARSDKKTHDTHAFTLVDKHKMVTSKGTVIAFAAGKRKNAVAQVYVRKGTGEISINGKSLIDYFPAGNYRDQVLAPLAITLSFQQFDIKANVRGGGMTGQSESIRLALAKAISYYDPVYTMALQKAGLLKTDTRIVERKKPGHRKARKMQQWVKR